MVFFSAENGCLSAASYIFKAKNITTPIAAPQSWQPPIPAGHKTKAAPKLQPSEHHGRQPPEAEQRQVVVQEGGHDGIPDVIVLAICVQAGGGAEGGIGGR